MDKKQDVEIEDLGSLPNGCHLYRKYDKSTNAHIYYSDEVGCGIEVWNTALVDESTLLRAIVCEYHRRCLEEHEKSKGWTPQQDVSDEKMAGTGMPTFPVSQKSENKDE